MVICRHLLFNPPVVSSSFGTLVGTLVWLPEFSEVGFLLTEGVTAPNNVNALPITNNRFGVLDDDDFDDLPFLIIGTAVCDVIPGNGRV